MFGVKKRNSGIKWVNVSSYIIPGKICADI